MGIRDYEFRGRTYDQWELGEDFITGARTITEADIVNFAGLSGDWSATHTNVALLDMQISYQEPVRFEDTIYCKFIPVEKRPTKTPGRGLITFHVFVYNQNDEQVAEERLVLLISSEKGHI